MIRNIIFDIGNVLTDYRWEGFLADKGFDAEMIQKIAKASVMHPAWAEYDRGTWTDEQVLAAFVKMHHSWSRSCIRHLRVLPE